MPPVRVYFAALRAFIIAFAGVFTATLTQLSGTTTSIALTTWLMAVLAGLVAAVNAGRDTWDAQPPRPSA